MTTTQTTARPAPIMYFTPPVLITQPRIAAGELGQMVTPNQGNRVVEGARWIFDNGKFSSKGWTPERYFAALDKHAGTPGCVFAVVPDVVAEASGTNKLWGKWHLGLMRRGYPTAYVIQDGATSIPRWCDAIFIGGSDEFKLGREARILTALAKRHGKWVHMGRVNSYKRLAYAAEIGCDSADGTFITFKPAENLARVDEWYRKLAA
jgi:hypothetical protein